MLANGVYSATATDSSPFNTKNAIIGRDRADCTRADLIIMNLLGAKKVSIGTMVELGWSDMARKPESLLCEGFSHALQNKIFSSACRGTI